MSAKKGKQRARQSDKQANRRRTSPGGKATSRPNWSIDDLPVEMRAKLKELMDENLPGPLAQEHLERRAEPAKRKKRHLSKRQKLTALLASPAVLSGIAGAMPQATINLAHQTVQSVSTLISHGQSDKYASAGGEYYFSGKWQTVTNVDKAAAVRAAGDVVDLAMKRTGNESPDGGVRRRYIQWILAGEMTPAEVAQIVATKDEYKIPVIAKFESLMQIIRDDRYLQLKRSMQPIHTRYKLGDEWTDFTKVTGTVGVNRLAAVLMAEAVVNVAAQGAYNNLSTEVKQRSVQWVLAGNITPPQAGRLLLSNSPDLSTSPQIRRLVGMVRGLSST